MEVGGRRFGWRSVGEKTKKSNRFHGATEKCIVRGTVVVVRGEGQPAGPGKSASLKLYSSAEVDPKDGKAKLSERAYLKEGKTKKLDNTKVTTYKIKFHVEPEFGILGALLIKNKHKNKFFLESVTLQVPNNDNEIIHFDCKSWVYPFKKTNADRLFFSNKSYLPDQTPKGLSALRKEELRSLRGEEGDWGERKEWDRVYEYDYYNDIGDPDHGLQHLRPVLGESALHPYPRRLRTGHPRSTVDVSIESRPEGINLEVNVPPDEQLSPKKQSVLISNSLQAAVHFLIPELQSLMLQEQYSTGSSSSSSVGSFDEILDMFSANSKRNLAVEKELLSVLPENKLPDHLFRLVRASKESPVKFPIPQIIAENVMAWKDDKEFGRQMLAGVNPTIIKCLETFPPRGKRGWSSIRSFHIEHNLEGLTVTQAMEQWRIFILDHHDYLLPFLDRINAHGACSYASRTLLFLRNDATLKPLAIELSLPAHSSSSTTTHSSRVFVPAVQGTDAALWQLAKAHVAANDSAYHQLVTHWLKTHAVIEPVIIASRRQLSVMHPIHWLLGPHFRDTIHVNALARRILINAGGILETILFSGEFSMELSAELYKDWRFDEQGLPADLVKRRMAFTDPEKPAGVQLLFEDYPYGADGLDIWIAISTWVRDFCSLFYKDDDSVKSDREIQAWWSEIQHVGHEDKRNEKWWYQMTTISELIEALTTIIWTASALHASVNFGQYGYAGYPPNRPTMCRKFIPEEGTLEFAEFLRDPDKYYLSMLPERLEMRLGVALVEVLSRHTSDEQYLGQKPSSNWTGNKEVYQMYMKFREKLQDIEKCIMNRNRDPNLKNRWGPAKIPYRFLCPDTSISGSIASIMGKGIPSSISI
ncbi:linoleate 9S-lipoxygenase 6-like [Malania oleifera]|uniref:linoleate 9S-lipoxygenase 6-like n=1 Tax=Malania oleifera TaxID=397392 RepID=UPI0025AEA4F8|nr:linoleate 9S-lipoxygenase 6-like [Malania oleifera]